MESHSVGNSSNKYVSHVQQKTLLLSKYVQHAEKPLANIILWSTVLPMPILNHMLKRKKNEFLLYNSESQHHVIIIHQNIISVIFKPELYKVHVEMIQV